MTVRSASFPCCAVLFDIDGTLADTLDTLIAGLGDGYKFASGIRPSDDEIKSTIGTPLRQQMNLFRAEPLPADKLAEAVAYTIERFHFHAGMSRLFEPAVEALRYCHRQGIPCALVTSKSRPELDRFYTKFPLRDLAVADVCADDVSAPKPNPESAFLACRKLGVQPTSAVWMIGDSVFDIRCGRAAGLSTVAVTYGAGKAPELRAEQPDIVLDEPQDLLEFVQRQFDPSLCLESQNPKLTPT
ncbi:MAG: N-acetylmuramic acid 6-phosphate phosphatase [Fimbriimonadaceae bacterium]|nr:N-acetylmuramic acid 6-phosphate phosphatase [Fimbriimonadaceae bacterium]